MITSEKEYIQLLSKRSKLRQEYISLVLMPADTKQVFNHLLALRNTILEMDESINRYSAQHGLSLI